MFPKIAPGRTRRRANRILTILALGGIIVAAVLVLVKNQEQSLVHRGLQTAPVRRADVDAVVLTSGRVASSRSTEIRCTLERLDLACQGGGTGTQAPMQTPSQKDGASAIISLVPDGATVKRGEVLCELDSSEYQELARRQQIVVEEAKAEHSRASLTLEVAKLALRSYHEGEKGQVVREYKGEIALTRSDLSRQTDRLAWSRRMLGKGYVSAAQVASDAQKEMELIEKLRTMELTLQNFQRYTSPKEALAFESDVLGAKSTLDYQSSRLKKEQGRLAHYQSMVDRCTIRAPHDGYVVYANRPGREPEVYLGAPVRERMLLFSLPDPTKMQVEAMLHETEVKRVRAGMPASVLVEAMPARPMSGRVESVAEVPKSDQNIRSANQIAYFLGRVELTTTPSGLRPGMTAEISILSDKHKGVLTVPSIAVREEDGREFCYVDRRDHLERRPVKVIRASHDNIEVVEGLTEGERVVLDPDPVNSKVLR
jgi:HlyD family secretion protein